MASFAIPLTGLDADSAALNTIANDLANMNTTGFKSQSSSFADLFYQQVGSSGNGDPIISGLGTCISGTDTDFSQGSIETTGNGEDMAVDGNGFFIVSNGNGQQFLTRSGDFSLNSNGDLVNPDGLAVMGYPAVNGTVNTNTPLQALNVPSGETEPPQATQNMSVTANLSAASPAGTTFDSTIQVYDSLGNAHTVTLQVTKSSTANQWTYSVSVPGVDASGASGNTGTLTFNSSGQLTSPTGAISGIDFTGLSDGASNMSLNLNFFNSSGQPTLTQTAAASAVASTSQDGYPSGKFEAFTIASNGTISAEYDNGNSIALGQVALGTVTNVEGLQAIGGNEFSVTQASGGIVAGLANSGGRGSIVGGALEESNVNISEEFANLITAQRSFEANSKSISTFDTIAQDTISMVR